MLPFKVYFHQFFCACRLFVPCGKKCYKIFKIFEIKHFLFFFPISFFFFKVHKSTEMATVKPIIKLPPRSKSISTSRTAEIMTNELFFEDSDNSIHDFDIQRLLQDYNLIQ